MSDIEIGMVSNSAPAQKDLAALNASIQRLVQSSEASQKAMLKMNGANFDKFNHQARQTHDLLGNIGNIGQKSFTAVSGAASATAKTISVVTTAISATIAAFAALKGANAFQNVGDDLLNIQSRLRLVTNSSFELAEAQQELNKVSRETHTGLKGNAETYFNLSRSLENSGKSMKEFAALSRTISQAAAISGGSVESIAAAMIQLNQGLASGVLRGEEFNSVGEQMPAVLDAVSKHLGMTRGELRAFAKEGGISAEILVASLESQAESIDKMFKSAVVTAAKGFAQLSASLGYLFGQLNIGLGTSENAGKFFVKLSEKVDAFGARVTVRLSTIIQTFKNFRDYTKQNFSDLDIVGPLLLAMKHKAQGATDETFTEIYRRYKETTILMDKLDTIKGRKNDRSIIGVDFSKIKLPDFSKVKIETLTVSFAESFYKVMAFIKELAWALTGLVSKFHWLVPEIRKPVMTLKHTIVTGLGGIASTLLDSIANVLYPFKWAIAGITESVGFLLGIDTELERAWANVFFARGIDDITGALQNLGDASRNTRFADLGILFGDFKQILNSTKQDVVDLGIYLGIVEKRGLYISTLRFDRLVGGLETFRRILSMAFFDVLIPALFIGVLKYIGVINYLFEATTNVIEKSFTEKTGFTVGSTIGKGLVKGFIFVKDTLSAVLRGLFSDRSAFSAESAGVMFANNIKRILVSLALWVKGFFHGLFTEIDAALAPELAKIEGKIKKFTENIANHFFEVYDKVVGHSYWPDMIDGVVSYTQNIFAAEAPLKKYKEFVLNIFRTLKEAVLANKDKLNIRFTAGMAKLDSIDLTALGVSLKQMVGASVLAGLMFVFGGTAARFIAVDFFVSTVAASLSSSLQNFIGGMSGQIGESAGVIASVFAKSMIASLNVIIAALPAFMSNFVSSFGGAFSEIGKLMSFGPNNNVLYAAFIGMSVYALKAKKGIEDLGSIMTGYGKKQDKAPFKNSYGLLDYGRSMLGMKKDPTKIGNPQAPNDNSFTHILGTNQKMVLASLAIIASSALDSISLLEASVVGVPLLFQALFGAEVGGKMIRDSVKSLLKFIGAQRFAFNVGGGAVSAATGSILASFKQIGENVKRNAPAYLSGALNIRQMFMQGPALVGPLPQGGGNTLMVAGLRAQFKALGKAISEVSVLGYSLSSVAPVIKANAQAAWGWATAFVGVGGAGRTMVTTIVDSAKSAFVTLALVAAPFISVMKGFFSTMIAGITGTFAALGSLRYVLLAIAATLASTAFAATETNASMLDMGKTIGGFVFSWFAWNFAIGLVVKSFRAFRLAMAIAGSTGLTGMPKIMKAIELSADFAGHSMQGFKTKVTNAVNAAGPALVGMISSAEKFGKAAYKFATVQMWDPLFWSSASVAVAGLRVQFALLATVIWTRVLTGLTAVKGAFGWLISGHIFATLRTLRSLTAAFGLGTALKAFGPVGAVLSKIVFALSRVTVLMTGLIGLAVTAVGLIGVWFFGRGDTLSEKLQSTMDRIKAIFGMKPSGDIERLVTVREKFSPINVGGETKDLGHLADGVDFEKMSSKDYSRFLELSEATGQTMAKMEDFYAKQGSLTAEQTLEMQQAQRDFEGAISRAPQRQSKTLEVNKAELFAQMDRYSEDLSAVFFRILEAPLKGLSGLVRDFQVYISEVKLSVNTAVSEAGGWLGFLSKDGSILGTVLVGLIKYFEIMAFVITGPVIFGMKALTGTFSLIGDLFSFMGQNLRDWGIEIKDLFERDKSAIAQIVMDIKGSAIAKFLFPGSNKDDKAAVDALKKGSGGAFGMEDVERNWKDLTADQRKLYENAVAAQNEITAEVRALRSRVDNPDSKRYDNLTEKHYARLRANGTEQEKAMIAYKDALKEAAISTNNLKHVMNTLAVTGAGQRKQREFSENIGKYGKDADLAFGFKYGTAGEGFAGNEAEMKDFHSKFVVPMLALKAQKPTFDNAQSLLQQQADIKKVAEAEYARINGTKGTFDQTIEYRIKLSGINVTKEAIQELFKTNLDAYNAWAKGVDAYNAAKIKADTLLTEDTNTSGMDRRLGLKPDSYQAAMANVLATRNAMNDTMPGSNQISRLAEGAAKFGQQYKMEDISLLGEDATKRLKENFLDKTENAFDAWNTAVSNKKPLSEIIPLYETLTKRTKEFAGAMGDAFVDLSNKTAEKDPLKALAQLKISNPNIPALPEHVFGKGVDRFVKDAGEIARLSDLTDVDNKNGKYDATTADANRKALFRLKSSLDRNYRIFTQDLADSFVTSTGLSLDKTETQNFKNGDSAAYKELYSIGQKLEAIGDRASKGPLGAADIKKRAELEEQGRVISEKATKQFGRESFGDILGRFNTAGFTFSPKAYDKFKPDEKSNIAELTTAFDAQEAIINRKGVSKADGEAALKERERIRAQIVEADAKLQPFVAQFSKLTELFPDMGLSLENLSVLGAENTKSYLESAKTIQEDTLARDEARLSMNDSTEAFDAFTKAAEKVTSGIKTLKDKIETQLGANRTSDEELSFRLKKAGKSLPTDTLFNPAARSRLSAISTSYGAYEEEFKKPTTSKARKTELEGLMQENLREIDLILANGFKLGIENSQAYAAAGAFAANMVGATTEAFKSALKGQSPKGDKGFLGDLINTFTSNIVDTFVDGFMASIAGKKGFINQMLMGIGGSIFNFGADTGIELGGSLEERQITSQKNFVEALDRFTALQNGGVAGTPKVDALGNPIKQSEGMETMKAGFSTLGDAFTDSTLSMSDRLSKGMEGLGGIFSGGLQGLGSFLSTIMSGMGGGSSSGGLFGTLLNIGMAAFGGGTAAPAGAIGQGVNQSVAETSRLLRMATGGLISGPGTGTSDNILAMVSNGEFIVNAAATKEYSELLSRINTGKMPKFAAGGLVGGMPSIGSIASVNNNSKAQSSSVFNINITGDISRQTKSEIYKMLPSIASGVNQYNREKA